MGEVRQKIEHKLQQAFEPSQLEVLDTSHSHVGHAGYQEGGESHFDVKITAAAFVGKSRVAQHRAIYAAIGADLMAQIHALAIDIQKP